MPSATYMAKVLAFIVVHEVKANEKSFQLVQMCMLLCFEELTCNEVTKLCQVAFIQCKRHRSQPLSLT